MTCNVFAQSALYIFQPLKMNKISFLIRITLLLIANVIVLLCQLFV